MALGGYIFRGYQCEKGALTDTEWALLIHKTRIKAFISAAEASGSSWSFRDTNGDISFESYGAVIYNVDSSGYNFVSFFKYGAESKYFAVISMFNQTVNFSNEAVGGFSSSGQYYICSYRTCYNVASLDDFASADFMLTGKTYPQKALSLYPVGSITQFYSMSLATTSTNNTLFKESKLYLGYAIKGKEIACFTATNTNAPSGASPYIFKQCFGFDSMSLSSPDDSYNIFAVTLDYAGQTSETMAPAGSGTQCNQITLTSSGVRYNEYNKGNSELYFIDRVSRALFRQAPTVMPYESLVLSSYNNGKQAPFLNADGIESKGTMNVEFLAENSYTGYFSSLFAKNTAVSQGQYLAANYNNQTYSTDSICYYVGWDSTNPDILTEGAWTAYSGT